MTGRETSISGILLVLSVPSARSTGIPMGITGPSAAAEPCERGVCQIWGEEPAGTGGLIAGEEGAVKQSGEAANLPKLSEQDTVH